MIRFFAKRVPLFWLLQAGGWGAYGLAFLLATLPYLNLRDVLFYRVVFTASCFAASLFLHVVCRTLWRRQTRWPRALLIVLVSSYGLGFFVSLGALAAEDRLGAVPPRPVVLLNSVSGIFSAGFVLLAWSALYFGAKYYLALEAERRRTTAAEASAREAELRALRYQVQPHFLFNTLNAISTLVVEGNSAAATRMIARLADFFRATLEETNQNEVPLENELFLAEQYLEIEKIRLGERLVVELNIDPAALPALVPHLLLQPLIENAIRHGIAPLRGGGRLIIHAEKAGDRLRIKVADSGQGISAKLTNGHAGGIGLANTERRLRQMYLADHGFELRWPETGGCEALIDLPFRRMQQPLRQEAGR